MELKDIADIQVGLHEKPKEKGEIAYLQAKHFNFLREIEYPEDSFIMTSGKMGKHQLSEGDVLLAGKGYKNLAWTYKKEFGPAVASTMFFVIKPDLKRVLPEFLSIVFNTSKSQAFFKTLGAGSSIPSIRKSELEAFPVSLPDIATQKKIIKVNRLNKKNIEILEHLIDEKEKLNDAIINKLIDNYDQKN
ncbi:MAG: restriction endonuclease subunit S [Candidatus Cyclobacteriaceae bacterium M2_1C_046]